MHRFLLAVLFAFLQTSRAFNCTIPPVFVDTHLRAVAGTEIFEYGAFIGFGTPTQNQSLWPSLTSNETSVAAVGFCQDSDLFDCANSTGGFYDFQQSNSYVPAIRNVLCRLTDILQMEAQS